MRALAPPPTIRHEHVIAGDPGLKRVGLAPRSLRMELAIRRLTVGVGQALLDHDVHAGRGAASFRVYHVH